MYIQKHFLIPIAFITLIILMMPGCLNTHTPDTHQTINEIPKSSDVLFVSNRDTHTRSKEVYSMNKNGHNITRITFSNYNNRLVGIDKTGTYLVITRTEKDTNPPKGLGDEDRKSVWIVDLNSKTEKRLTDPNNNAEGDSFSPDGKWIVFHMVVSGDKQADIYKIKRDGTNLTRLTYTKDATESDPSWSNNGKHIAFVSYGAKTHRFILKIMDTDGKNIKTIYDCKDDISTPYFKPGVYDPS